MTASANDLLQYLRRGIGFAIVAVSDGHLLESLVAPCLTAVPVKRFPVAAQHTGECVAWRQRDTNTEFSSGDSFAGFDKIMLVAIGHSNSSP